MDEYDAGASVLPGLLQTKAAEDVYAAAGQPDYYPMMAGQSAGLVKDVPSAGDVMRTLLDEAESTLVRMASLA